MITFASYGPLLRLCVASLPVRCRGALWVGPRVGLAAPKMADAFGDELFSVFEDESTTEPGANKDKEKEKGKWKGPTGSSEKSG